MRTDRASAAIARHRVAALLALPLLFAAAPAAAGPPAWTHLEVGFWPEVTIVGLTGGARLELSYRPGPVGSAHRLRLAPGLLAGPDLNYAPIALGYRAILRSTKTVQPILGIGMEYQLRWVRDAPAAHQGGIYAEVGLQVAARNDIAVGLLGGFDFTFIGYGGIGVFFRVGVTWSPGARWAAAQAAPPSVPASPTSAVIR